MYTKEEGIGCIIVIPPNYFLRWDASNCHYRILPHNILKEYVKNAPQVDRFYL